MGPSHGATSDKIIQYTNNLKNEKRYQKYEKQSKKRRQEVKKAIEDGNMDIAKQYAQMAITDHKTGIKMLGLSSKLDAVAAKLESAQRMKQVSKQMASTVKGMEYAMKAMDVDKLKYLFVIN